MPAAAPLAPWLLCACPVLMCDVLLCWTVWVNLAKGMNNKELAPPMPEMQSLVLQAKLVEKGFTAQPSDYVATPATCRQVGPRLVRMVRLTSGFPLGTIKRRSAPDPINALVW